MVIASILLEADCEHYWHEIFCPICEGISGYACTECSAYESVHTDMNPYACNCGD